MFTIRPLSVTDGKDIYGFLQRLGPEENGFVNKVNGIFVNAAKELLADCIKLCLGVA